MMSDDDDDGESEMMTLVQFVDKQSQPVVILMEHIGHSSENSFWIKFFVFLLIFF